MASLAFTIVGSVLGGAPGALIGGAIGALIDSYVLFPAFFGQQTIQGPRLDDLNATLAAEGTPMLWAIGPRVRLVGTVIWKSPLIEVESRRRVGKGGSGQRVSNFTYFVDIAVGLCDTEGAGTVGRLVKVLADTKVIYDSSTGDTPVYEELNFYDGSQTTPDALQESYEGAGNVPSYINLCYLSIRRLALADFGNRIPNITAIIEQANDMTVGDAIKLVAKRAGYADDELDTSRVTTCFKGFRLSGVQDVTRALAPLTAAYSVTVQESDDGVITFLPKGSETVIAVDEDDLGAHQGGSEPTAIPITFRDFDDFERPSDVLVRYFNIDDDCQQGQQEAHRWNHPNRSEQVLDLPITLDGYDAVVIAKRVLYSAIAEGRAAELALPPKYVHVNEGTSLSVTSDGEEYDIWVKEVTRGANQLVEIVGTIYDPDTYFQTATVDEIEPTPSDTYQAPEIYQVITELPALRNADTQTVSVYFFACAQDPDAQWRGATLLESPADDPSFDGGSQEIGSVSVETVIGRTTMAIPDGNTTSWDEATEIFVQVFQGGLQSVTENECIAGANRAAIKTPLGWEIIGFVNATLVSTRFYKLTKLLRGLRNTEAYTAAHATGGERFVLLELATANVVDVGVEALGSSNYAKIVPLLGTPSDYDADPVPVTGLTERPFAPCHVTGEWDVSGNFTLNWVRRSKSIVPPFQSAPLGDDEVPETYEVDFVYGPGDGVILRTVTVTAPTASYSAADQSADATAFSVAITPGLTPWHVRIYQISRVVGRGNAADTIIFPPPP